ncbi:MAG: acyl-CoA thioesterase [Nitrosopumilaceae archaeon]|nr:acyl-CoA thioesterase [Nitrosopumilaceae archaeon]
MFPHDANPAGNVFGGVDRVDFLKPVYVGNALILNARLNAIRKSSMEIEVKVEAEDLIAGTRTLTGTALVTSVALDEDGRPTPVPKLVLKTKEEKQRFAQGIKRMNQRIKEKKRNKVRK